MLTASNKVDEQLLQFTNHAQGKHSQSEHGRGKGGSKKGSSARKSTKVTGMKDRTGRNEYMRRKIGSKIRGKSVTPAAQAEDAKVVKKITSKKQKDKYNTAVYHSPGKEITPKQIKAAAKQAGVKGYT